MSKVAVIGAGLIGRAWAISFARAGHDVRIFDQDASAVEKALGFIDSVLGDLAANDLLNGASARTVRQRIRKAEDLKQATAGAVHLQENAPEDLTIKQLVFRAFRDHFVEGASVSELREFIQNAYGRTITHATEINSTIASTLRMKITSA